MEEKIRLGNRNDTLYQCAKECYEQGVEYQDTKRMLDIINQTKCEKPVPEKEINSIMRLVYKEEKEGD